MYCLLLNLTCNLNACDESPACWHGQLHPAAYPEQGPCHRDKDGELGTLRSELAAVRHYMSLDARAARVTHSIDTAGMSLHAQSQVERLEAANAQLEVGTLPSCAIALLQCPHACVTYKGLHTNCCMLC